MRRWRRTRRDTCLILTKNTYSRCLKSILLRCIGWWSRCPLVERELTDIDRDSRERHHNSSLAAAGERRERRWKYVARRGSHSQTEAVFEILVSQAERCQCFGKDAARHRCKPTTRNRRLKEGRSTVETTLEDRSGSSLGISRRVTTEGEHCMAMHPNPIAPPPNPRGSRLIIRLAKVARTTCASFTAVLAFSALTIISVLYQPTRGPCDMQKLG